MSSFYSALKMLFSGGSNVNYQTKKLLKMAKNDEKWKLYFKIGSEPSSNVSCKIFITPKMAIYNHGGNFIILVAVCNCN